jgi:aarF domain-containing kinase
MADLSGIESLCHDMGVDKAYPLFAAMLTARPYDEIIEQSKTGSFREKSASPESQADHAVIRGYAKQFMKDILVLLGMLPPQMLLLLKMNDCLRHIEFALGSPTNTIVIAGKYAVKAIYLQDQKEATSFSAQFHSWVKYIKVIARIQIYDFATWMILITNSSGLLTNS